MNKDNIVHIMPDWEIHDSSIGCWCEPYLLYRDIETDGEVWTHRRGDN